MRMVAQDLRAREISDKRVLAAFAIVPREEFVSPDMLERAYADMPLPIGEGQTISQPYVVAMTVQALHLEGHERVLEIGAGSGYAAAILGAIVKTVHTVERIESLANIATDRLARLGFANVHVHCGDGTLGWPAGAPYDAIAVAAGAPTPPRALLEQLIIGGRLIVPTGPADAQQLMRITRVDAERFEAMNLGAVRFVPLIGEQGWPSVAT
jgi:protein-L-isoaspartate(D-aspartate) O-methyltransferase